MPRRITWLCCICYCLILTHFASTLQASVVDVHVTGTVQWVVNEGGGPAQDGSITVGAPITLTCSYVHSNDLNDDLDTDVYGSVFGQFQVGNYVLVSPESGDVLFHDGVNTGGTDYAEIRSLEGSAVALMPEATMWTAKLHLKDSSGQALTLSDMQFGELSEWDGYSNSYLRAFFSDGEEGFMAQGEIETMIVTPEPATLSLLALGGLALIRRRR